MPPDTNPDAVDQLVITVLRCSRCNMRLVAIENMARLRCDNCGAAYRKKEGKWIGDGERWETKDSWKRIRN